MIFNKNTLIKTRKHNVNTKKKIDKKFVYQCTSKCEIDNLLAKNIHDFNDLVFNVFDFFVIYIV